MSVVVDVENVICSAETMARHPELFHYTGEAGFRGIVQSRTFWASHYREMDDKREVLLLRDLLPAAIAPRMEAIAVEFNRHRRRLWKKVGGGEKTAADLVKSLYGATFDGQAVYSSVDAFSVSFSTHAGDTDFERENGVRSQWERYAGLDGYCLVFDTAALADMLGKDMDARYWVRLSLDPVRYADMPIEDIFPELVEAMAVTLRQFAVEGVRTPEVPTHQFLTGATLLKGADFRPEREVRIVVIPGTTELAKLASKEYPGRFNANLPLPEVRLRPGSERRYIAILEGLDAPLPVKRVIVGPGPGKVDRAELVRSLLGDVPVMLSREA